MNSQNTLRVRICVLAAAVTLSGVLANAGSAYADNAQDTTNNVASVAPHQGPGTGSVKAPPFYDAAYLNSQAQSRGEISFHTSNNASAVQAAQQYQGPGIWSVKAPGIH